MNKQLWIAVVLASPAVFAQSAFAQQCTSDAECADGEACLFLTPCAMPDCPPDTECPEVECFGECGVWDDAVSDGCETDVDCGEGFTCETESYESCASAPPCAEGEDCPEPTEDDCVTEEYSWCAPAPCASDDDCGEGLVCETYSYETCTGIDVVCPEGEPCPEPAPAEDDCETVTESFCAPPYVGGCATDADCGDGFTCREMEACACSGSGGTDGSSGGGVPADGGSSEPSEGSRKDETDPDCSCEPTGEFYCEPVYVECDDAADCPADWTCETAVSGAPCFIEEDGTEVCPEPETGTGACTPPYWSSWGAPADGRAEGGYEDTLDSAVGGEGAPTADDGGEGGGNSDGNGQDAENETSGGGGGCAAAPTGGGLAWLSGLVALIALRRRRSA